MKAIKGILQPIAVTPAVGWGALSPKSGAHSGCFNFSAIPSYSPFLISGRDTLFGAVAVLSYKKTGNLNFSQTALPTSLEISLHSSVVISWIGKKGTTSVAPILLCSPLCLFISISLVAIPIDSITAFLTSSGSPNTVTTVLL